MFNRLSRYFVLVFILSVIPTILFIVINFLIWGGHSVLSSSSAFQISKIREKMENLIETPKRIFVTIFF